MSCHHIAASPGAAAEQRFVPAAVAVGQSGMGFDIHSSQLPAAECTPDVDPDVVDRSQRLGTPFVPSAVEGRGLHTGVSDLSQVLQIAQKR